MYLEKNKKFKIEFFSIIIGIFIISSMFVYAKEINNKKEYIEKKHELKENVNESIYNETKIIEDNFIEIPKEKIISEYKGYDVIAKLEIPQINLETYVLKDFSENALNISVTKFWGPSPNEIGNLCIVGHNFVKKNMFHNLKKLKINDKIYILDNYIGRLEYIIYDVNIVIPDDVSCLSQQTDGKKELTLITCTSDSEKRIIVKAKEIKKSPEGN